MWYNTLKSGSSYPSKSVFTHCPYLLRFKFFSSKSFVLLLGSATFDAIAMISSPCTLAILLLFLSTASFSDSSPSYSLTQQLCTAKSSTKSANSINSIAMRIPHCTLTKSLASFGCPAGFSIERLSFSLVNKARTPRSCPVEEARSSEIWVTKQKRVS